MTDMIDRAAVQSEVRAYLVHESTEIALRVEQLIAALPPAPDAPAWKGNDAFCASLRNVPENAFKHAPAPDAVEALVKAHEKEIAVWSENYAALERKLDRVECLLQRAVDGYGQKMQAAKSKGEKRDWQTMLIAAADIQNAALAAIRAGGKP